MSRPKGSNNYTAQQFIDAIPGSGGIVSVIAKSVGCAWSTARIYIDEHPTVKKAYDDECQKPLDMAESVVYQNIQNSYKIAQTGAMADSSDSKWLLSKKGKGRGFGDGPNYTIDLGNATDDQLERLAAGEHPATVFKKGDGE